MGNTNCDVCGHDKKMCSCDRYVAQEGGDHYQAEYQHWDWVTDIGMGYLPGNATKYVARWRKKNGLADLKKALTYIDKMLAVRELDPDYGINHPVGNGYKVRVCTDRFIAANKLTPEERDIIEPLVGACDKYMIKLSKERLEALVRAAGRAQAPAATLPPAAPVVAPAGAACGAAGGAIGQAPATSAATDVHRKGLDGMEHPFGYDDWHEGSPK